MAEDNPACIRQGQTLTQLGVDEDTLFRVNTITDKPALDVGAKEEVDALSENQVGCLPLYQALLGLPQLELQPSLPVVAVGFPRPGLGKHLVHFAANNVSCFLGGKFPGRVDVSDGDAPVRIDALGQRRRLEARKDTRDLSLGVRPFLGSHALYELAERLSGLVLHDDPAHAAVVFLRVLRVDVRHKGSHGGHLSIQGLAGEVHSRNFVLGPVGVSETQGWVPYLEQQRPHAPPAYFARVWVPSFEGVWADTLLEGDFVEAGTVLRLVGHSIVDGYRLDGGTLQTL